MLRARPLAFLVASAAAIALFAPGRTPARAAGSPPALEEVEVVGKSGGKGDKQGAEKSAEDDAIKAAVQQVATELIGGEKAAAEKKDALAAKILKNARRYVPEFRIGERSEAGATVILRVKAKVAVDLLKADLIAAGIVDVAAPVRAMTRVVVLPGPSKTGAAPWWAQGGTPNAPEPITYVFVESLRAKGFEVTEPRRPEPDPASSA
ncbi:MAG TPA: hypothetical protein VMV18_00160, partial [bacterium]|nr:hypothetical protein [bacterium]